MVLLDTWLAVLTLTLLAGCFRCDVPRLVLVPPRLLALSGRALRDVIRGLPTGTGQMTLPNDINRLDSISHGLVDFLNAPWIVVRPHRPRSR